MSTKVTSIATSLVVMTVMAAGIAAVPAANAKAETVCGVVRANGFTVNNADKTITGSFEVKGEAGCTQPVSVMTWYADSTKYPQPEFFTSQKVNHIATKTLGVGVHSLTAKLPVCTTDPDVIHSYQADIIASAEPSHTLTPPGSNGFYDQIQANGTPIVVDAFIAPGTCPPAKPVVTPDETTIISTPKVVPAPAPAPVAPTPAVLPSTGFGHVAGIFGIVSAVSAALHRLVTRRR